MAGRKRLSSPRIGTTPPTAPSCAGARSSSPRLSGIAPRARLVSLKVLGAKGNETARGGRVIQALSYVLMVNASSDNSPRIHGVNLSLGYGFDPAWYACGSSPLCIAVDNLVRSGVIVVVAAGNSAYVSLFVEDQN